MGATRRQRYGSARDCRAFLSLCAFCFIFIRTTVRWQKRRVALAHFTVTESNDVFGRTLKFIVTVGRAPYKCIYIYVISRSCRIRSDFFFTLPLVRSLSVGFFFVLIRQFVSFQFARTAVDYYFPRLASYWYLLPVIGRSWAPTSRPSDRGWLASTKATAAECECCHQVSTFCPVRDYDEIQS